MRQLAKRGHQVDWYGTTKMNPSVLVVSKRQCDNTVEAVIQAKRQGTRIVLDFCDNTFLPAGDSARARRNVDNLRHLAGMADGIVAATSPLAEAIRDQCPDAPIPQVIGDLADDLSVLSAPAWREVYNKIKLRRELALLRQSRASGKTQLVWFGNNGGKRGQSGYADLGELLPLLDRINRDHPLRLTVISNRRQRFLDMAKPFSFEHRYIEWDAWTFEPLLREHDITLIPARSNAYSACKSDNRVISSLRAGVPVVANAVPSYTRYADVMQIGDIEAGLRHYLDHPDQRSEQGRNGRELAESIAASDLIVREWERALGLK